MTTTEFVKVLRERGEVRFDSRGQSLLEARIGWTAFAIAEALTAALGSESSIHGGYQTAHFDDDFGGEHVWWLVLDAELLRLWITMLGEKGNHIGSDVHLRFYALREANPPEAVFTYVSARGPSGQMVLREVKCGIPVSETNSSTFKPAEVMSWRCSSSSPPYKRPGNVHWARRTPARSPLDMM